MAQPTTRNSPNNACRSPKRSSAPNAPSSATKTPSRTAPSTPHASRSAYPPSTRLDPSKPKTQALACELAADAPTTPDTAALHAVVDQLAHVIATGDTDQTKALLRILIADLRVNSRRGIVPTYRVGVSADRPLPQGLPSHAPRHARTRRDTPRSKS